MMFLDKSLKLLIRKLIIFNARRVHSGERNKRLKRGWYFQQYTSKAPFSTLQEHILAQNLIKNKEVAMRQFQRVVGKLMRIIWGEWFWAFKLTPQNQDLYYFFIWGAMSQLAYLEEYNVPPSPRSRPLRLPYHLEPSLYLEDNPEKLDLSECIKDLHLEQSPKTTKSSILKFLELRPRGGRRQQRRL